MPMKTVHCSLCGKAISGKNFLERMTKLRRHRKQAHPKAHKESVKKAVKTRMTHDPVIHIRRKLQAWPPVASYKDYQAPGLIRLLKRKDDVFPEFAFYPQTPNVAKIIKGLKHAGLKEEERGKWVLRTDNFSIFVYM